MKEIILTDDEMRILKNHYYNERPFTTDEMLDLWYDIVKQILGEAQVYILPRYVYIRGK